MLGGAALGSLLGWLTYRLLATVDAYAVEVLLTVALAAGIKLSPENVPMPTGLETEG